MVKIINSNLIDLSLKADNKIEALKKMSLLLDQNHRLNSYLNYVDDVLQREKIATTGIGFGIAIPHGKTNAVKQISVSFGRLANSIEWNSLDGRPVDMVFLLAVPLDSKGDEHLRLLSTLSRNLIHEDFRNQLRKATSEQEVLDLIGNSLERTLEV